ncbi:MAG: DUF503 domain-containing protein [Solirubrobacterales bacterium]
MDAFVCLVEVHLHVPDSGGLKSKRKQVTSLKEQLKRRFGAAVAEIDGQDTWQRSTLLCALVGSADVDDRADALERFVASRFLDSCRFEREVRSLNDIRHGL